MFITLRIKKKFFNAIINQEKHKEYRSDKPFYARLGKEDYQYAIFHYQGKEKLITQILEIRLIPRPNSLKNSPYLTTPMVWEVTLGTERYKTRKNINTIKDQLTKQGVTQWIK